MRPVVGAKFDQAVALHRAGRLDSAANIYEELARESVTVNLAENLGGCLLNLDRLDEAEYWLRLALRHRPGNARTRYALAETLLALGRYEEGWPYFEARAEAYPNLTNRLTGAPEWGGEPLEGRTIVVLHEQGLGDQIQFARFVPMLKSAGAGRVHMTCSSPLERLFNAIDGVDQIVGVSSGEEVVLPSECVWVRYMSLARLLKITTQNIPSTPYLTARARPSINRVGVATAGNPSHPRDTFRSPPAEIREMLLDIPGAVNLDPSATGVRDLLETAEIMAGLDLVVSVDSAPAHLAGALGKPLWVLLPRWGLDWRWLRGRPQNPWYPTAVFFRQPAPHDWLAVVNAVHAALR